MSQRRDPFNPMPSTRWGLVAQAGRGADLRQRQALEALLGRYMPALRAHLVWTRRLPAELAEDLLQSFVMRRVLERALIGRADPARGRFRTFLLTALDRFVVSALRAENALRRAPRPAVLLELRTQIERDLEREGPAAAFEVEWARQVLDEALERMLEACRVSERPDLWGVFEARLLAPLLEGVEPPSYAEMVARFGFESPAQASNALITARRMFARTLRTVVAQYVADPAHIEGELDELKQILARSRR